MMMEKKLEGHISNEEYLMCQKFWDEFGIKNIGNYHDHYLKKDILLLADVFEKFIDTCLKFYQLDPCHYFSYPGLSWDAMLKMTVEKLENISDIEMYLFIEKGQRGRISYISKRYSEANKKYMKNYDFKKPSKFVTFLDMNNLYGWARSGYLPHGWFKQLKNVDNFDVSSISEKSPIGYILDVDLESPDELHLLQNDYPLAPEKLVIPYDMLSDYCKDIADKYGRKVGDVKKLIPNLGNKTNDVVHYRNLQLYLSLEMKPVLKLNKPIYVGYTVLELSKWLMYDFRYNFIKKHFDVELLFTDTDSLSYEVKSKIFIKNFLSTKICLTLVTIQKIQSSLMSFIKKLLVKRKTCQKEK